MLSVPLCVALQGMYIANQVDEAGMGAQKASPISFLQVHFSCLPVCLVQDSLDNCLRACLPQLLACPPAYALPVLA